MIKIKILQPDGKRCNFPESEFHCPECGMPHQYFSTCPENCLICMEKFPDLRAMGKIRKDRLVYHFGNRY